MRWSSAFAAAALTLAAVLSAQAQEWADYATVSMTDVTTPKLASRNICYSDGRDIACDGAAGLFSSSGTLSITNISVTALTVNGAAVTGGGGGANTFASLTDVSYSAVGRNIYGPGSLSGAAIGVTENTALGVSSLASTTTGYQNSAFGSRALARNTTGYYNTAVGDAALFSNVSGSSNVGVGSQALRSNTGGNSNVGVGYYALYYNTMGAGNVAQGVQALYFNTTGNFNTAVGHQALRANTTATQNTAFGYNALTANTDGGGNSAFGAQALGSNISGLANTAFGGSALYRNVYGTGNTAIGSSALSEFNTTGGYNTAAGVNAMLNVKNGSNNVAMGVNAGYGATNATVTNTVAIGAYAGQALTSTSNNVLVGYNAGGGITSGASNTVIGANVSPFSDTGHNQLALANAIYGDVGLGSTLRAKVGVNVTSPTVSLEVSGTISASGVIRAGVSSASCTNGLSGAMRYNAGSMEFCNGSAWTALGTSAKPYFHAALSSAQNVAAGTTAKITYSSEIADTSGAYDTTQRQFCPATTGKYLVQAVTEVDPGGVNTYAEISLYKNGSALKTRRAGMNSIIGMNVSALVDANGSDCFSAYLTTSSWPAVSISADSARSYFEGIYISP